MPRICRPGITLCAWNVIPAQSFPCAEVEFLEFFHDVNSAVITLSQRARKHRASLRRTTHHAIHARNERKRRIDIGRGARCERNIEPSVACARCDVAACVAN